MTAAKQQNQLFISFLVIIAVVTAAKFAGGHLFDNDWSFTHWHLLPFWFHPALIVGGAALVVWGWKKSNSLTVLPDTKWSHWLLLLALAATLLFPFDSFLYSGGNLTVGHISQADVIIPRAHQFGLTYLVSWIYYPLHNFLSANDAAALAWRIVSWLSGLLTLWWGWQLSGRLTEDRRTQLLSTAALFFGPQAAMFFGFVAPEPVLTAATIGAARYMAEIIDKRTTAALGKLWLLQLIAALLYLPSLYLLPAVLYVTLLPKEKKVAVGKAGLILAILAAAILLVALYYIAGSNLELAAAILFFSGKNPNSDYGIFSGRHLADMLQVLVLAAPQILMLIYFRFSGKKESHNNRLVVPFSIMLLCGLAMICIWDPVNGIVLDFPALLAYLAPVQLLLILLIVQKTRDVSTQRAGAFGLAALSLFILLSWFPVQRSIDRSQNFVEPYLKQHDNFYRPAIYAFRDAYFAKGNYDNANTWELKLASLSPDYIDLNGCKDLAMRDNAPEALRELYKLKANFPYWGEPYYVLAGVQSRLGRFALARPELDTALMLEPYNKLFLMALYGFYRDQQAYEQALREVKKTLTWFPNDSLILSDYMIITFRAGNLNQADSLRGALQERFPNMAYPYAVEAMMAERTGNLVTAKRAYEDFMKRASDDDPDKPVIRKRLNEVVLKLREQETTQ